MEDGRGFWIVGVQNQVMSICYLSNRSGIADHASVNPYSNELPAVSSNRHNP